MNFPATKQRYCSNASEALAYIHDLYNESCQIIEKAFQQLLDGTHEEVDVSNANYPFVGFTVEKKHISQNASPSYGVFHEEGVYGATLTRPTIFHDYYFEQISLLIERHNIEVMVGLSEAPIPMPFVVDHTSMPLTSEQISHLQSGFVLPNLSRIDDAVPNSDPPPCPPSFKPLTLFSGERVDFSLHRLQHYTGTANNHFQSFILLTNYQRYIQEFIDYSAELIQKDDDYTEIIGPQNKVIANKDGILLNKDELSQNLPQMPAYHLKRKDKKGITFINIGVGPSNAKTITDHLAVLRPDCWLMLGHCAGLRSTQILGDYVLAHAYVRDDHVLDQDLPIWIPIPALAEVQVALEEAVRNVTDDGGKDFKARFRTGTLITTDNRNWELRSRELYQKFKQSRAIAVDMESATVAANGFRFRVPYGTLLCVSDKPIHGEIKLQGMANAFYRQRVHQHLQVGLEAVRLLREGGFSKLHSRKLRGFDEPPFR